MNLSRLGDNDLLFIGFNQDQGCFACGTNNGFRIFNSDPFRETFRREFPTGGIGYVEMLFRCNILALVGGGRNPRYPPNKVMIWDDHQNRCIGELSFRSEVYSVKLRRDRIVVVLRTKIYVYNFKDLKIVHQIETIENPKGLCALCPNSTNSVLACPGLQKGLVRVELYDLKKTTLIQAHETELSCLALNMEGTRLATASEKGTLIRVFDTLSGQLLQELRRGADRAEIYSIAFNYNCNWLCVSSDHGTIHIFALHNAAAPSDAASDTPGSAPAPAPQVNKSMSLGFMKGLLPKYFSSEWSFAHFRIPDVRTMCAFGQEKNTIIAVCADGSYFKYSFDPEKGGEAKQETYSKFFEKDSSAPM